MNGMPHGTTTISSNNFDGHFCIHFKNSKTHESDKVDPGPSGGGDHRQQGDLVMNAAYGPAPAQGSRAAFWLTAFPDQ